MHLDQLESEDRGFLTWFAAMARVPLPDLWAQLLAEGAAAVAGTQLTRLDLRPVVGAVRAAGRRLSLPLGGLDALQVLDVSDLDLDQLDLRPLRGLREVRCARNRLRELDLSTHPELEVLDCSDNQLTRLDLRANPRLREWHTDGNPLESLLLPSDRE
jgi:Leucine-rich repeat (LRR) protein